MKELAALYLLIENKVKHEKLSKKEFLILCWAMKTIRELSE